MKNPFANLFKKKAQTDEKKITPQASKKKKRKRDLVFLINF